MCSEFSALVCSAVIELVKEAVSACLSAISCVKLADKVFSIPVALLTSALIAASNSFSFLVALAISLDKSVLVVSMPD